MMGGLTLRRLPFKVLLTGTNCWQELVHSLLRLFSIMSLFIAFIVRKFFLCVFILAKKYLQASGSGDGRTFDIYLSFSSPFQQNFSSGRNAWVLWP